MKKVRLAITARNPIAELIAIAAMKGGKCLSTEYISNKRKLTWQCAKGHVWESSPERVKGGNWCLLCSRSAKGTIEEMMAIAASRGGKCLSTEYINRNTKLQWQCSQNHVWNAVPTAIVSGTWCPVCSSAMCERICRIYFETIFATDFPKSRPPWLRNADGNQMELDGYSTQLGLAFEHQGTQHYKFSEYFHRTRDVFDKREVDDKQKARLCAEHGVRLIAIPQLFKSIRLAKLRHFIVEQAKALGVVNVPDTVGNENIDISKAYFGNSFDYLAQMRAFAEDKGGRCLSEAYISTESKLLWQCSAGHTWRAAPERVQQGSWCPVCDGNAKLSIEEMRHLASERGGKCLSATYTNAQTKLQWQCSEGHVWEAFPYSVKRGRWCRTCLGNKFTKQMHKIAAQHGGKCLTSEYVDSRIKLKWQCANGHTWDAILSAVRRGGWCPFCYGNARLSMDRMHELAAKHGGKCLSHDYVNSRTELKWQCAEGHIWESKPSEIKRGYWCPFCKQGGVANKV
jgi:hypothetical protein